MSGIVRIGSNAVPKLAPHMRLRLDQARQSWTIQAPERSFLLDETAHAIVSRCDGTATIDGITDALCAAYPGAPREVIETDVRNLLQNFLDKGVMTL
jgi:pyrroloquinoline quinone biosynthesis protein D